MRMIKFKSALAFVFLSSLLSATSSRAAQGGVGYPDCNADDAQRVEAFKNQLWAAAVKVLQGMGADYRTATPPNIKVYNASRGGGYMASSQMTTSVEFSFGFRSKTGTPLTISAYSLIKDNVYSDGSCTDDPVHCNMTHRENYLEFGVNQIDKRDGDRNWESSQCLATQFHSTTYGEYGSHDQLQGIYFSVMNNEQGQPGVPPAEVTQAPIVIPASFNVGSYSLQNPFNPNSAGPGQDSYVNQNSGKEDIIVAHPATIPSSAVVQFNFK